MNAATTLTELELSHLWYDPSTYAPSCVQLPPMRVLKTVTFCPDHRSTCGNQEAAVEKAILSASHCEELTVIDYPWTVSNELVAIAGSSLIKLDVITIPPNLHAIAPKLQHVDLYRYSTVPLSMPASVLTLSISFEDVGMCTRLLQDRTACPPIQKLTIADFSYSDVCMNTRAIRELLADLVAMTLHLNDRRAVLCDKCEDLITYEMALQERDAWLQQEAELWAREQSE